MRLRLLTKSAASENQEQARLCRTVKRLIFVPFRPAALPPLAAQNPRSGVCHHSETHKMRLRLLTKSAASENQEQARLCRTVKRLIFVPFRPAALPPLAAQNPRSGVCHHSETHKMRLP